VSSTATDTAPSAAGGGPRLLPYFLILGGMSAGLASIMTLVAELRNELGFSEAGIGLAIGSGFGAAFVATLVMAPHADRGKAPRLLQVGIALGVCGLVLLAVGDQLWHFVVGRIVFGFSLGTAGPGARRTVIVADPDNLGRNMGRLGAWDIGGFVVGPFLAAVLNGLGGFRLTFWVFAGLFVLLLPMSFRAQPDTGAKDTEGQGFRGLFRIRRLIGAFFVVAAYFVFIGAMEAVWILELDIRGASSMTIGIGLTVAAMPIALLSPWGGILAQRYGARRWAIGCLSALSLAIVFYGIVPGVIWLLVVTMLTSVIEGFGFPSTPMLVAAAVTEERQASAQGLMSAVSVATGAIAAIAFAALYGATDDLTVWVAVAVVMAVLLAIGAVLTRPPDRQPVRPGVPFGLVRRLFQ
jgi:MFS family permease